MDMRFHPDPRDMGVRASQHPAQGRERLSFDCSTLWCHACHDTGARSHAAMGINRMASGEEANEENGGNADGNEGKAVCMCELFPL